MTAFRFAAISTVAAATIAIGFAAVSPGLAQMKNDGMTSDKPVTVGGAPMYSSKNIIQNAVNSKDHTTLVAAVKAAGLHRTDCRHRLHQRELPARETARARSLS